MPLLNQRERQSKEQPNIPITNNKHRMDQRETDAQPAWLQTLCKTRDLPDRDLLPLLEQTQTASFDAALFAAADRVRRDIYGDAVYIRGLIEFTNICRNDCYYCGIRRSNSCAARYRLDKEDILQCCRTGYALGFRTFVLQGGEDPYFTDARMCDIVCAIRTEFPDCAITLSLGERSYESYQKLFCAGANRYLLRHETANEDHYRQLHPPQLHLQHRMECLLALRNIGYQVGSGFMVGSPFQRGTYLLQDLRFLQKLRPEMIGIGPFLPHAATPFATYPAGSLALTLRLIALLRLMFPYALIPATTALATIDPCGREMGLKAGANVVMPNLSPPSVREKYRLYDNKAASGAEAAESRRLLEAQVAAAGYRVVTAVGDAKREESNL